MRKRKELSDFNVGADSSSRRCGEGDCGSPASRRRDPLRDALRLIRFRARSEWEVRSRLERSGYAPDEVDRTIEVLKTKGFLDDQKFAYLYAYDSLTVHRKGPFRIRYELRKLNVNDEFIEQALKRVLSEVDVNEIVLRLTEGLDERKKKEKLYRHGFSPDLDFD